MQVELPNATDLVVVDLTFLEGATVAPSARLGSCAWSSEATWVATGQSVGFGCDDPPLGKVAVEVAHEGPPARLRVDVEGVLRLCSTPSPC